MNHERPGRWPHLTGTPRRDRRWPVNQPSYEGTTVTTNHPSAPGTGGSLPTGDADLLAIIADTLHGLADILTTGRVAESADDQAPADPARAAANARQALQAVRDNVQDVLARAEAATQGSNHPKVVQAMTALRAALVEAGEAVTLLQDIAAGTPTTDSENDQY